VDYRKVELEGKHGRIILSIPNREPTKEEEAELYGTVAEVLLNAQKAKGGEKAIS